MACKHTWSPPDWEYILGILPSFSAVGWPVQRRHSVNIVSKVPRDRTDRCARQREIERRTERGHVLGRAAAIVIPDDGPGRLGSSNELPSAHRIATGYRARGAAR